MGWETYLEELERELSRQLGESALLEARDLARVEASEFTLAQRLRAVIGKSIVVNLRSGQIQQLCVQRVGKDWLFSDEAGRQMLIPLAAITLVRGLERVSEYASVVDKRLSFQAMLRRLTGEAITVTTADNNSWSGILAGVWADHLDLCTETGEVSISLQQLDAISGAGVQ